MSNIFQKEHCSYQQNNSHTADEDVIYTPTAPRGKRSDITEKDRDLFVSSFRGLLDILDNNDKENIKNSHTKNE